MQSKRSGSDERDGTKIGCGKCSLINVPRSKNLRSIQRPLKKRGTNESLEKMEHEMRSLKNSTYENSS